LQYLPRAGVPIMTPVTRRAAALARAVPLVTRLAGQRALAAGRERVPHNAQSAGPQRLGDGLGDGDRVFVARVRQHCTGAMPPRGSVVPSTRTTVIAYLSAISVEV
jgi:hypothetical protein